MFISSVSRICAERVSIRCGNPRRTEKHRYEFGTTSMWAQPKVGPIFQILPPVPWVSELEADAHCKGELQLQEPPRRRLPPRRSPFVTASTRAVSAFAVAPSRI